jgi:N,N'-diacetyllegionaminate synthase
MISDFAALDNDHRKSYIQSNVPQYQDMLGSETRELTNEELLNRCYYRGRFASQNPEKPDAQNMIYNWEEAPIK